jgi:hypothetical protein
MITTTTTTTRALAAATVLMALLVLPATAAARLAPTTMQKLLAESELVVLAVPRQLTRDQPGPTDGPRAGSAELVVLEVLKGTSPGPNVTLRWGDEVHDQAIDTLLERRLLFLKKSPEGRWIGTHYGRSYWPLVHLRDPKAGKWDFAARVRYPVTMVRTEGLDLVREVPVFDEQSGKDRRAPVIFLGDLRRLLKPAP